MTRLDARAAAAPQMQEARSSRYRLDVAIPTFRRPEQLRVNLEQVRLRAAEALDRVDVRVVVIDNDPTASARPVLDAADARSGPVPVVYVHEPTPGIAAARNRALDEARHSRLLAFLDDDEIPQAGWLASLVDVWSATGADAVMGRVISQIPPGTEPWVASSSFFHRGSHPTGMPLRIAATGNLLLDLRTMRRLDMRFDESLGLGGGEDTVFTSLLTRRGGRIVWCQESAAIDPVVPERLTRTWVLNRAYAHGNAILQVRLRLAPSRIGRARVRLLGLLGGPARVAVGAARQLWGLARRDPAQQQRGASQIRRGHGVLHGALGAHFEEYARREASG